MLLTRLFRPTLAIVFLFVALSAIASSQTSAPILVPIEFRAQKNGASVVDLRPNEVSIRVSDVEHEIRSLDLIRPGSPTPFATNLSTRRGRDFIFVLDEESIQIGGESVLRNALSAMLTQLTPQDRVGLISLHASGVNVALSSSATAFKTAIPLVRGRAGLAESATTLSCRTRRLLPTLSTIITGIDAGVTTTVLLFSNAMAAPAAAAVPASGAEVACVLTADDFNEFRAAASRSAAELFAIQIADATTTQLDPRRGAGLERLAGEAGGQFLRISGDPSTSMTRIAAEASGFYVATVAIDPNVRDKSKRPVSVRVRRDGVTARSRPELAPPALETKTTSPRDMLRVATGFRDLPLRAAAFPSRDAGNRAKLVVLFEPLDQSVSLTSAAAGLYNEKGQLVAQWSGERDELAGRPVGAGLVVQPGKYRLRVAAVDSRGRSGAVDDDLVVEMTAAGPATTSGVVLGLPLQSGFAPRLQFTTADNNVAAYVEVYGVTPCTALLGTIEIAASEKSQPLTKATATPTPVEQSDACILFGGADTTALAPGDYTLRVSIQRNGEVIGTRVRILRKASR